jgi:hypothetical protein
LTTAAAVESEFFHFSGRFEKKRVINETKICDQKKKFKTDFSEIVSGCLKRPKLHFTDNRIRRQGLELGSDH